MARGKLVRRRPLLRAAAVGGGAYTAGKARQRHLTGQERAAGNGGQPASATGQSQGESVTDQLSKLSALHDQGALSDSEFAAAKSRLLGR
jgi:hypothetical protein